MSKDRDYDKRKAERRRVLKEINAQLKKKRRPISPDFYTGKGIWVACCPIVSMREARGWTVAEFGEKAGISTSTYNGITRGRNMMEPETCARIAKPLEVDAAALWHLYLEWLAMEPTLDAYHVAKMAGRAVRNVNPVMRAMKVAGIAYPKMWEEAGISDRCLRMMLNNPDRSPSLVTMERVAEVLGMDLGVLARRLRMWQQAFESVPVCDRITVALELEADMDEEESHG